jgi:hypothetical protein
MAASTSNAQVDGSAGSKTKYVRFCENRYPQGWVIE